MSSDEALAFLSGLDICFGPVNSLLDAFEDENVKAREMILRDDLGRRHFAPVIRFRDEPSAPRLNTPALGENTEEVLKRAGRLKPDAA